MCGEVDEDGDVLMRDLETNRDTRPRLDDDIPFRLFSTMKKMSLRSQEYEVRLDLKRKCSIRSPSPKDEGKEDPVPISLHKKHTINVYEVLEAAKQREEELERRISKRKEEMKTQRAKSDLEVEKTHIIRKTVVETMERKLRGLRNYEIINLLLDDTVLKYSSSEKEKKRAIKKCMMRYHPDRHVGSTLESRVTNEELYKIAVNLKDAN